MWSAPCANGEELGKRAVRIERRRNSDEGISQSTRSRRIVSIMCSQKKQCVNIALDGGVEVN